MVMEWLAEGECTSVGDLQKLSVHTPHINVEFDIEQTIYDTIEYDLLIL
jgi:hypothetical protein